MWNETSVQNYYKLLALNSYVFLMQMEVNDWKPLMVGVTQLWKLELKAKLQHNNDFSVLIMDFFNCGVNG